MKSQPLKERRALLEKVLGNSGVLLSETLPGTLKQITAAIRQHGLEGIVAKRLDSKYQPGRRSDFWLKHPLKPKQDFVIGGYRLEGKRLELLLVGYFEQGKLLFAAKVRQGLNPFRRAELLKALAPLRVDKCPFANLPSSHKGHWGESITAEEMSDYIWTKPEVVVEIKFTEWTHGDVLRHAEFAALREDMDPKEVVREG